MHARVTAFLAEGLPEWSLLRPHETDTTPKDDPGGEVKYLAPVPPNIHVFIASNPADSPSGISTTTSSSSLSNDAEVVNVLGSAKLWEELTAALPPSPGGQNDLTVVTLGEAERSGLTEIGWSLLLKQPEVRYVSRRGRISILDTSRESADVILAEVAAIQAHIDPSSIGWRDRKRPRSVWPRSFTRVTRSIMRRMGVSTPAQMSIDTFVATSEQMSTNMRSKPPSSPRRAPQSLSIEGQPWATINLSPLVDEQEAPGLPHPTQKIDRSTCADLHL